MTMRSINAEGGLLALPVVPHAGLSEDLGRPSAESSCRDHLEIDFIRKKHDLSNLVTFVGA
jgi:hypothetical protein